MKVNKAVFLTILSAALLCQSTYNMHLGSYLDRSDLSRTENPSIDKQDDKGQTALHRAVIEGNPTNVLLILQQGADPDVQDKEGKTPLHHAAIEFNPLIVHFLVRYADASIKDSAGNTAGDIAIKMNPARALLVKELVLVTSESK
jgi:ankyrin